MDWTTPESLTSGKNYAYLGAKLLHNWQRYPADRQAPQIQTRRQSSSAQRYTELEPESCPVHGGLSHTNSVYLS